jgi:serine/threonine-protein kinase
MAPEQVLGRDVSRRTDVYAAGVVLWEVLTSQRLFTGESEAEIMRKILRAAVPPASSLAPDVGPGLDAILARALEAKAERRFVSALDFADALESCNVPMASARVVGAFVRERCARLLDARRRLVREIETGAQAGTPGLADDPSARSMERSGDTNAETVVPVSTAASHGHSSERSRALGWALFSVATLALGVGVGSYVSRTRSSERATANGVALHGTGEQTPAANPSDTTNHIAPTASDASIEPLPAASGQALEMPRGAADPPLQATHPSTSRRSVLHHPLHSRDRSHPAQSANRPPGYFPTVP